MELRDAVPLRRGEHLKVNIKKCEREKMFSVVLFIKIGKEPRLLLFRVISLMKRSEGLKRRIFIYLSR